ncbi:MAG: hypothetical protein QM638_18440 [Nocardioides sp.]|uniref:hypothetical protein n=1 Tax=Nocardioides sp. TaxID=35761 RepID=UPI0039E7291E
MAAEATTYRYVRLILLALLLALAISVAAETVRTGWQTSISAYYYTAAGPVFIAVLCCVGACLVALRGLTDAEDVCLNLAGISAPMVAFVPTPELGRAPDEPAIANSALTYLVVLAVGYLVVLVAVVRRRSHGGPAPTLWSVLGLISIPAAWVVGVVWILVDRDSFATHAHALAAVFTFLPFVGVVLLNTDWGVRVLAWQPAAKGSRYDVGYWSVLAAMALAAVVFAALWSWDYALLGLEISLLLLFAAFWVLQSIGVPVPGADPDRRTS